MMTVPHRVAVHLMQPVKDEHTKMEELGVITCGNRPTDWCAGSANERYEDSHMHKSHSSQQECVPAVEQSLAQLAGTRVFSTLDANSGFWQIPLE